MIEARAAALRANLELLAASLDGGEDVVAFLDGVRQRLFAVDVLAGFERGDRHVAMQMLGRHDNDRVDRFVLEHLVVVVVGVGRRLLLGGDVVLGLGEARGEGVADGLDVGVVLGDFHHGLDMAATAIAEADPSQVHFGPRRLGAEQGRSRGQRGRTIHKCTARNR